MPLVQRARRLSRAAALPRSWCPPRGATPEGTLRPPTERLALGTPARWPSCEGSAGSRVKRMYLLYVMRPRCKIRNPSPLRLGHIDIF